MVPMLEEYKATIGIDFKSRIIEPPIGLKPASVIAEFLNLKTSQVEKLIKSNTGRFSLSFLMAKYSKLPKETGNISAKVFILAFFGFFLFPISRTGLNPLVAERHMRIQEICSAVNPIERYLKIQEKLPKYFFHEWANFIRALTPDQFQWRIKWPKIVKARITCQEGNLVPLLGLNGGTTYCPLRIVRQFGMIQYIPPGWHPEEFTFAIPQGSLPEEESRKLQKRVDKIIDSLKRSTEQMVKWPEDLKGEMKLYLASNEYIKWLKAKRPIDIEPYIPLSVTINLDEPYVPEYIMPNTPGVEPYILEEVVIGVEEWEARVT
ncbi:uncharacterized protein LOC115692171 [Syzygium oleosum]|uniref:uncharacterized protein LOC115692171 n=1 Tax=Syzygium oleosum TaxID=219896 RepID=UPI0024BB6896|nr:uncharacterized protein LOC115692171 [Syzygium oleosum]